MAVGADEKELVFPCIITLKVKVKFYGSNIRKWKFFLTLFSDVLTLLFDIN